MTDDTIIKLKTTHKYSLLTCARTRVQKNTDYLLRIILQAINIQLETSKIQKETRSWFINYDKVPQAMN